MMIPRARIKCHINSSWIWVYYPDVALECQRATNVARQTPPYVIAHDINTTASIGIALTPGIWEMFHHKTQQELRRRYPNLSQVLQYETDQFMPDDGMDREPEFRPRGFKVIRVAQ